MSFLPSAPASPENVDLGQLEFALEPKCDGLAGVASGEIAVNDDFGFGLPSLEEIRETLIPLIFVQENRTGHVLAPVGFGRPGIQPENWRGPVRNFGDLDLGHSWFFPTPGGPFRMKPAGEQSRDRCQQKEKEAIARELPGGRSGGSAHFI